MAAVVEASVGAAAGTAAVVEASLGPAAGVAPTVGASLGAVELSREAASVDEFDVVVLSDYGKGGLAHISRMIFLVL